MGKKGRQQFDDDENVAEKIDNSKGFVSYKQ